jgi:hypothetical protein
MLGTGKDAAVTLRCGPGAGVTGSLGIKLTRIPQHDDRGESSGEG